MYGKRGHWVWMSLMAVALFLPTARAGCNPAGHVGEWLTTNPQGELGLMGYRYRLKKRAFVCSGAAGTLETEATMLVYQDLPKGVAMVEYWAKPSDLETDTRHPTSYGADDLQTMLYVGAPLDVAAEEAVANLLGSGQVEFLFVRYGVELPAAVKARLDRVKLFARTVPGQEPLRFEIEGSVLSLMHLEWARMNFLGADSPAK